jgi:tRNA threonylcarbamoyladenosine dehydratase
VDLLAYCTKHNLRVISSMGAGAKSDPTRIQIADIANTVYDPLARSVRRKLRAVHNVASGIPVVYSTEVPGDVKLLPLPEEEFQKGAVHELGALDDFRVRILPVLGKCTFIIYNKSVYQILKSFTQALFPLYLALILRHMSFVRWRASL